MGQTVSGRSTSVDDIDDWGLQVHRDILGYENSKQSVPSHCTKEQRIVFQRKLHAISELPSNYIRPFERSTQYEFTFDISGNPKDRLAALSACSRLPGISHWKPNLVPRLVSEANFFSNLFSYIEATAIEHYSDESNLRYFYMDAEEIENLSVAKISQFRSEERKEIREIEPAKFEEEESSVPVRDQELAPASTEFAHARLHIEEDLKVEEIISRSTSGGIGKFSMVTEVKKVEELRLFFDIANSTAGVRFANHIPRGARTQKLKNEFYAKPVFFFIEKSQNLNTVVYEANLDKDGQLDANNPIHPFWIMYEKEPVEEEELTLPERLTAYGISSESIAHKPGHFKLYLAPLKSRPLEIWIDKSGYLHVIGKCKGVIDELLSIYVHVTFNWVGLPTVEYVDLIGRSTKERIANTSEPNLEL